MAAALFRSSSPVNNELGRASYADALAMASNIQAVMDGDIDGFINAYLTAAANGEIKK